MESGELRVESGEWRVEFWAGHPHPIYISTTNYPTTNYPTTNYQLKTTNYQLPNYQLPPTNYQLPPANYPTTNCQLPTTNYQLPNYKLQTTNYQLPNYPTTNYQLPTTNYQLKKDRSFTPLPFLYRCGGTSEPAPRAARLFFRSRCRPPLFSAYRAFCEARRGLSRSGCR